jgi:hypothetical protein
MPNIKEFYNNDSAYVGATWTSNVIYCADVSNIVFTLYESQNCNIIIRYISNNNPVSIIDTTTTAHIGGTTSSIDIEIKTLFLQIYIDGIAVSPSILRSNGIWFLSTSLQDNKSYGHISLLNNFTSYNRAINSTGVEISGYATPWVLNVGINFTMTNDGQLKYIGTHTQTFILTYQICVYTGSQIIGSITIAKKNGVNIPGSGAWATISTVANGNQYSNVCFVSLSTNDYVSIYHQSDPAVGVSPTVNIYGGNLTLLSLI